MGTAGSRGNGIAGGLFYSLIPDGGQRVNVIPIRSYMEGFEEEIAFRVSEGAAEGFVEAVLTGSAPALL